MIIWLSLPWQQECPIQRLVNSLKPGAFGRGEGKEGVKEKNCYLLRVLAITKDKKGESQSRKGQRVGQGERQATDRPTFRPKQLCLAVWVRRTVLPVFLFSQERTSRDRSGAGSPFGRDVFSDCLAIFLIGSLRLIAINQQSEVRSSNTVVRTTGTKCNIVDKNYIYVDWARRKKKEEKTLKFARVNNVNYVIKGN